MNKKTCLVQLTLVVALTFVILQFFTKTVLRFQKKIDTSRNVINYAVQGNTQVAPILLKHLTNVNNHKFNGTRKKVVVKKLDKLVHRFNQKVEVVKKNMKILFWGTFYEINPQLQHFCITDENTMNFCDYKCEYSTDDSEQNVNQSDAIVFHGREKTTTFPKHRTKHQRWIFLMFESPDNSWTNFSHWNNIFDWTMSYRQDSDIFVPYGKLTPVVEPKVETDLDENIILPKKNMGFLKLAAWAVSNCQLVTSERKALVDELSKFMPVDVYGSCGLYQCPGIASLQCDNPQKCFEFLGQRYKFYFAFENSICEDYITEKFFLALKYGMVPVVHGPSKEFYLQHAPSDAFIHVRDYPNLSDLADYLLYLNDYDEEYMKYFSWKQDFVLDQVYYFQRAWCNLCRKLHEETTAANGDVAVSEEKKADPLLYPSVHDWWFYKNGSKKKDICRKVIVMKNATFTYQ